MENLQEATRELDLSKDDQTDERKKRRQMWLAPRIVNIMPGLSLGNVRASKHTDMLTDNHITAIVSLSDGFWVEWEIYTRKAGIPSDSHMFVKCHDLLTQDLLVHLSDICDFIDKMAPKALADSCRLSVSDEGATTVPYNGPSVLVHCDLGRSRSPATIIAYLMRKFKIKRDEAMQFVQRKQIIKPNASFLRQLQIWEQLEYDVWEDPEKTIAKAPYRAFLDDRAVLLKTMPKFDPF